MTLIGHVWSPKKHVRPKQVDILLVWLKGVHISTHGTTECTINHRHVLYEITHM